MDRIRRLLYLSIGVHFQLSLALPYGFLGCPSTDTSSWLLLSPLFPEVAYAERSLRRGS